MITYICAILPWAFLIVWSSWPWLLRFPDVFTKSWSSVVSSVNSWSTVLLLSPRGNSLTYSLLQRLESNVHCMFYMLSRTVPIVRFHTWADFIFHSWWTKIYIKCRCLTYDNILASFPTGDEEKIKSPMSITMIGFYFQKLKLIFTVSECLGIP